MLIEKDIMIHDLYSMSQSYHDSVILCMHQRFAQKIALHCTRICIAQGQFALHGFSKCSIVE